MTDQTDTPAAVVPAKRGIPEAPFPAPARTVCLQVLENHAADHYDGGQVVFGLAHPPVDAITGKAIPAADRTHAPIDGDDYEDGEDAPEAPYPAPPLVLYSVVQRNRAAERAEGGVVHFTCIRGGRPKHLLSADAVLSAYHNALLHQYPHRTRAAKASRYFRLTLWESTTGYVDTVHTAEGHAEQCVDARFALAFDDDASLQQWPWKTSAARASRYFLLTVEEVTLAELPPDPDAATQIRATPPTPEED